MESKMSIDSRFEQFMLSLPSVEGIDTISLSAANKKKKKADYLGMGRKVVFEQKCINQDQANKIQAEVAKYVEDENYPIFYGERDFNLVIDKLPNKEDIKRKALSQITRLLESYLSQANKQINSTQDIFNLDNPLGVLVILNEKVKILSPEVVASKLQQRMLEKRGFAPRFKNIDYIIFVSETHQYKGVPCIVIIEGERANYFPTEVKEYIDYIVNSWAQYNGGGALEMENKEHFFSQLSEVTNPDSQPLTRSEARLKWYKENRYMINWTDEEVAKSAAEHIDSIQPHVMKGAAKLPDGELAEQMMIFGDYIEESNLRGLDVREFKKHHKV